MKQAHQPVLVKEILQWLFPPLEWITQKKQIRIVDATVGAGGHAQALLTQINRLKGRVNLLGLDQDQSILKIASQKLRQFKKQVRLVQANFTGLLEVLKKEHFSPVHYFLFDLGVSSHQLDQPSRGFSFQQEGPLDMRMNISNLISADRVINQYPENDLAECFFQYGEEKKSRQIARAIVRARQKKPIQTTTELAQIVSSVVARGRHWPIHPATKVFQAVRILVNDELQALREGLKQAVTHLAPRGRIAVISFHSLEDRITKRFFLEHSKPLLWEPIAGAESRTEAKEGQSPLLKILTKKPIVPQPDEVLQNLRSRSAKLRVAEAL